MSIFPPQITAQQVLGLDASALIEVDGTGLVHPDVVMPMQRLRERARVAGFDLRIASGYRDFARQLAIFNAKATGQRPVVNDAGQKLDIEHMSECERLYAILRFSALPGTSRHHWGTDFDVYDAAAQPDGYVVQLSPGECQPGAVFGDFHQWLSAVFARQESGFFRPYHTDTGGVAPEPWHISYGPVARHYAVHLSLELLRAQLEAVDIALKNTLLAELPRLFERFVVPSALQEDQ